MAAKLIVLIAAIAACAAVPVWVDSDGGAGAVVPGVVMRVGRAPSMAFGFGSGFSSSIGGISHSTGMGGAFQSGAAQAYGAGMAGAGSYGNNAYAQGVGLASSAPQIAYPLGYQQSVASAYNGGRGYNGAASSAQNFGNYGSALAQTQNGLRFGSAQNNGYQSALSSAQSVRGLGYNSAVSAADSAGDYGSSLSSVQSADGLGGYQAAVSAAQREGAYGGSTAQTVRQRAGALQSAGASSLAGPGLRAAHSHAVDTGNYY